MIFLTVCLFVCMCECLCVYLAFKPTVVVGLLGDNSFNGNLFFYDFTSNGNVMERGSSRGESTITPTDQYDGTNVCMSYVCNVYFIALCICRNNEVCLFPYT